MKPTKAEKKQAKKQGNQPRGFKVNPKKMKQQEKEFFDGASKSKRALQNDLEQFVAKGMPLIHGEKVRKNVLKALNSANPVKAVADVTLRVVQRVDVAMRQAGKEISPSIKMGAATALMGEVLELGEVSGLAVLQDDEKKASFADAINRYVQGEIAEGRMDKDKVAEANGAQLQQYDRDEMEMIDQDIKDIHGVTERYKGNESMEAREIAKYKSQMGMGTQQPGGLLKGV